jgi:hypothetical protein
MAQFFNFQERKSVNPLKKITRFFVNPYMPENYRLLNLSKHYDDLQTDQVGIVTEDGHVPCITFPIEFLVEDTAFIEWRSESKFVINKSIWCQIVDEQTIRVDTVRF